MKVPILRVPYSDDDVRFVQDAAAGILSSGALTMGRYTREFEERFAAFTGSRFAVAVANGTTALEVILRALEIEGGSVVVPTNTFLATALAVMHAGNRVIFADSDPETFALDVADVEGRIAPDTRAVIVVHIGGLISGHLGALADLCARRGLHLIEDCAHAHGSSYQGRAAGTVGVAGGFSFFPTKVLVTGEGGMITTSDDAVYRAALKIRNHGKDPEAGNQMTVVGGNFRIGELTAALGVEQMRRAGEIVRQRQEIASQYDRALGAAGVVRPVAPPVGTSSTFYKYIAYLPEGCSRATVKAAMRDRFGVALTGEVYADLCHREPLWLRYDAWGRLRTAASTHLVDAAEPFPGAEKLSAQHICLPLYPGLTPGDVHYVVEALAQAVAAEIGSAV